MTLVLQERGLQEGNNRRFVRRKSRPARPSSKKQPPQQRESPKGARENATNDRWVRGMGGVSSG